MHDVIIAKLNSSRKLRKTKSQDVGEQKTGFHEIFSSKTTINGPKKGSH